jgi:hypothetical protein
MSRRPDRPSFWELVEASIVADLLVSLGPIVLAFIGSVVCWVLFLIVLFIVLL